MYDLDIQISGDNSVIDLELAAFGSDTYLSIHNDLINPADTLYLVAPKTNSKLEWQCKIQTDCCDLDLMILLNNDTYIRDGSFKDFNHVMISNHNILERTNSAISLDDYNKGYDVKLIIENFILYLGNLFHYTFQYLNHCLYLLQFLKVNPRPSSVPTLQCNSLGSVS